MTDFLTLFLIVTVISVWAFLEYMRNLAGGVLRDPQKSCTLLEATAAIPFSEKMGPLIDENSELFIVSGVGDYPNSTNGAAWIENLKIWLKRGAHISYIVTGRTHPNFYLCELRIEYPDQFHFVVNNRGTGGNQKLVSEYRHHHPSVLVNSRDNAKQAMWIEGFHGDTTHIAENVEYVAPHDILNDNRFQKYLSDVRLLKKSLSSLSARECAELAEKQPVAA